MFCIYSVVLRTYYLFNIIFDRIISILLKFYSDKKTTKQVYYSIPVLILNYYMKHNL
jgi:hypothetical protein